MGRYLLFVVVLALGCAGGEDVSTSEDGGAAGMTFYGGFGGSGATGGSSGGKGGTTASGGNGGTTSGGAGSGGTVASGGVAGATGTGATGATGGGGTGGSSCPAGNTCATAEDLGTMSGDTDGAPVEKSGFGSTFYKV